MARPPSKADQELLQLTANRLCEKEDLYGLQSMSEQERVFFLVWIAEGMVNNGGMHAVCANSTGNYLQYIPAAFRAIGASKKAILFERLISAFGPKGPASDWEIRVKQHEELSEEIRAEIDTLDDQYYAAPEDFDELMLAWCRPWAKQGLEN